MRKRLFEWLREEECDNVVVSEGFIYAPAYNSYIRFLCCPCLILILTSVATMNLSSTGESLEYIKFGRKVCTYCVNTKKRPVAVLGGNTTGEPRFRGVWGKSWARIPPTVNNLADSMGLDAL